MPEYMLLLYVPERDDSGDRWADMPLWSELTENLRTSGLLIANNPLSPVTSATTVRVRGGETELTDGPFAITKEILAGYYLLNCADLDQALHWAAQMPTARLGSVEVRPVISASELRADVQIPADDRKEASGNDDG